MSFLKKLFGGGKTHNDYAFRLQRARELHGLPVKYITERKDDNDDVIGRGGFLTVKGDEFIVDSSGDRLFVCKISNLDASYLMSGDGVIVKGPNELEGGKIRTITVHFVYYRK